MKIIHIPLQPARRLILRLLCWFSMIYVLTGQHLSCNFRAFCTFCTLMSRNISQEYSFFLQDIRSFCKDIQLRNKISLHPIFNFRVITQSGQHVWSTCLVNILPNHFYYCHITYFGTEIIPKAHSANFVCKVNDFFWLYVHSARFSCRMCLLFNIYRRTGISSCHNFVSVKRKTDEFWRCKFRFNFRFSYI